MKTEQNKATCIWCCHYDDVNKLCTHSDGLLREIELSDSMANAKHNCQKFSEATLRLSPTALLEMTLEDHGIDVSFEEAKLILDSFMDKMIKNGYIKENEKTD